MDKILVDTVLKYENNMVTDDKEDVKKNQLFLANINFYFDSSVIDILSNIIIRNTDLVLTVKY
jgi:hypothetical protein